MSHLENEGEKRFTELLEQINKCVKQELLNVAIMTSLAIPDIAGAINSKEGLASKTKYTKWFNDFCKPKFNYPGGYCLNGNDCYFLRCSILHQGKAEHENLTFSDIVLCEIPQASNSVNPVFITGNNVLLIEPKAFCSNMTSAAYHWLDTAHADETFKKNTHKFIKLFSLKFDGLSE